jgi:hypothetical protein
LFNRLPIRAAHDAHVMPPITSATVCVTGVVIAVVVVIVGSISGSSLGRQ